MPEPFIHFESVWKKFHRGEHHDTLRDLVLSVGRRLTRREIVAGDSDEFWAVRDVSFEVRPGETLGIIGGNGAGKSTVLRLLTRIMRPNRGTIRVEGRIGALIEVSAGFHPDLTGRENIFLQGSLIGMRKATIEKKFDEIVEFSGISTFLDTPVKRYSSGMNARLGFAIAAHLDPDVMIIDEVLSVGDFRFQQKAFGRLKELAQSGRPVVVVSHQLDRIVELCSKAIALAGGSVLAAGSATDCISAYLGQSGSSGRTDAPLAFSPPAMHPGASVPVGMPFTVSSTVSTYAALEDRWVIIIRVRGLNDNQVIFATGTSRQKITLPSATQFEMRVSMQANVIPGQYSVELVLYDPLHSREICTSAPGYLQVTGDDVATGRAYLGGRIEVMGPPAKVPAEFGR
jgi:ABC-type polysaccharide/polyol phosphate transport system ATPase subunit